MSYLTQMAGLAVQNFLSAATGIVVAIALIRGFARHARAQHRQLLGRPDARDAVRAAAAVAGARARAGIAGRDPELQPLQGRDHGGGADLPAAQDRCRRQCPQGCGRQPGAGDRHHPHADACRWARWPRRRASRSSAPTAAASSTPTRRTRTRTRPRCRTSLEMLAILLIPAAPHLHLRPHGRGHPPGLGGARRHGDPVHRAAARSTVSQRAAGQPAASPQLGVDQAAERDAVRRQHGRQGGALRHRRLGAVRHRHHRDLLRRGQRACTTRSRRSAASCRCSRCSSARWCSAAWVGAVLDADLRDRRGVHRRAHDRAHARVPRQEDRGVRDEDELDRDPGDAVHRAGRHRGGGQRRGRQGAASPIPARTASPRSSTRSPPPATTTAAPSRAFPPTLRSTTWRWPSSCGSGASGRSWRCSRSPAPWPRRSASR